MRFLILSDIHGNAIALKELFKQIDKYDFDEIIWCGDYVTDFPYSHETIELIKNISKGIKSHIIIGNRDKDILDMAKGKEFVFSKLNNLNYTYNQLTDKDITWIKSLPEELIIRLSSGKNIYVSHCFDEKYIENCRYKIFGHAHQQMQFEKDGVLYINSGSLGINTDGKFGAEFSILDTEDEKIEEYILIYDVNKILEDLRKSPIYNDEVQWGKLLEKELLTGIDYPMNCVQEYQKILLEMQLKEDSIECWKKALTRTLK